MPHGRIIAEFPVTAERAEIRQVNQMSEAVRCNAGHVPEEVEFKDALEPGQTGESIVGERTVDQEVRGIGNCLFVRLLQPREIVQQGQTRIRDQSATAEVAKPGFSLQRLDSAIAGRRTHQVHALQMIAKSQIRNPRVRYTGLPRHLECPEVRQMPEHRQSAIGELATRVLAHIQML